MRRGTHHERGSDTREKHVALGREREHQADQKRPRQVDDERSPRKTRAAARSETHVSTAYRVTDPAAPPSAMSSRTKAATS